MKAYRTVALALIFVFIISAAGCACSQNPLSLPDQTQPASTRKEELPTPSSSETPGMGADGDSAAQPEMPQKLADSAGSEPTIKVYDVDSKSVKDIKIEKYVEGVLAGEMKNDWPMEALAAQAILARTFVLKFIDEKESKYPGAYISTDIEEAQAYDASGVNDRIREAVERTRGKVLSYEGELPFAWFHAHSGGVTARAKIGLNYKPDEPGYTKSVASEESPDAPPEDAEWTVEFTKAQLLKAAADCGYKFDDITSFQIGETGESGRAIDFLVNNQKISAPEFRIAIGSTKMKSTLIIKAVYNDGKAVIDGRGYGHGVGMSQWGAYKMANDGKTAEDIINKYFNNVQIAKMWD